MTGTRINVHGCMPVWLGRLCGLMWVQAELGFLLLLLLLVLFLPTTVGGPLVTASLRHQMAAAAREHRHDRTPSPAPHQGSSHSQLTMTATIMTQHGHSSSDPSAARGNGAAWSARQPLLLAPYGVDSGAGELAGGAGASQDMQAADDSWSDNGSESSEAESEAMPAAELTAGGGECWSDWRWIRPFVCYEQGNVVSVLCIRLRAMYDGLDTVQLQTWLALFCDPDPDLDQLVLWVVPCAYLHR